MQTLSGNKLIGEIKTNQKKKLYLTKTFLSLYQKYQQF